MLTLSAHFSVNYKNAYIIRGGIVVKSDGEVAARREGSQIPIFGNASADTPAKSYTLDQWSPGNLTPASGVAFDYIDGTGGLVI